MSDSRAKDHVRALSLNNEIPVELLEHREVPRQSRNTQKRLPLSLHSDGAGVENSVRFHFRNGQCKADHVRKGDPFSSEGRGERLASNAQARHHPPGRQGRKHTLCGGGSQTL